MGYRLPNGFYVKYDGVELDQYGSKFVYKNTGRVCEEVTREYRAFRKDKDKRGLQFDPLAGAGYWNGGAWVPK